MGLTGYASIDAFLAALAAGERSAHTLRSYRLDLIGFARWFAEQVPSEPRFTPEVVTPTDIREFRDHLVQQRKRKPTTVNRKLAALRAYFAFCKAAGVLREDAPIQGVKRVAEQPTGPRWYLRREVNSLIREVERHARGVTRVRDLAIVLTLRHTGLRVGELAQFERTLIRERTVAGLRAARAGTQGGRTVQARRAEDRPGAAALPRQGHQHRHHLPYPGDLAPDVVALPALRSQHLPRTFRENVVKTS